MLLELQTAASGQPEVQEDPLLDLDERAPDGQVGTPAVLGLDEVDTARLLGEGVPESGDHTLDEDLGALEVGVDPEAGHALLQALVHGLPSLGLRALLGVGVEVIELQEKRKIKDSLSKEIKL